MKAIEQLGEALRGEQDAQLAPIDASGTRDYLLLPVPPPRRKLPLMLVAAALVVVALSWWGRAEPVTFTVAGARVQPGAWVAARDDSLDVSFSDGSRFALRPGSRVRVEKTTAHGARLIVERGGVDASVEHLDEASWAVRLGPYEVHVIGTRFTATWHAEQERLRVELYEGRVEVVGPQLGDGIRMIPGQRLEVSRGGAEVVLRTAAAAATATAATAPIQTQVPRTTPPPSLSASGSGPAVDDLPPASTSAPPPPDAPDWRALAAERRYRDSLAAAKAEGLSKLTARLDAGSLLRLADVARFGGDGPTAILVLQSVRGRFAGSKSAARAAFLLGTLSPSGPAAAQWFMTYVSEAPHGALVREARGRIVEAHVASGTTAAAQAAAGDYLRDYPEGPHAALARRTLGVADGR